MTFPSQQPPSPVPPPGSQPAPPPPHRPQGPGGAYGPVGQPAPGQMPTPMMTMSRPGTVTGIQAILWIFLALGTVADVVSIVNMIDFFHPLSLVALVYALYVTIQSVLTPVHIARGRHWAWIWNLVSTVIGLVFSAVGIVFGVVSIDFTVVPLLAGLVLAGLYGTLLGLLCSKSARQWILMHRIQRGEAQVAGLPGTAEAPRPERPASRPGTATFAVVVHGVLIALSLWTAYDIVTALVHYYGEVGGLGGSPLYASSIMTAGLIPLAVHSLLSLCALISGILVFRGLFGGRVFGTIWISVLLVPFGYLVFLDLRLLSDARHFGLPPDTTASLVPLILSGVGLALLVCLFILLFMPGVRRWTPRRPATALVMMVPMGQPGMPAPQAGPPQPGQYQPPRY